MLQAFIIGATILILVLAIRIYQVLPTHGRTKMRRPASSTCSLAVFLGSGGHTSEALKLMSALDFNRYSPRTYVISEGDTLSAQKAVTLEAAKAAKTSANQSGTPYTLLVVPRARHVHQSLLTAPPTALLSLLVCIYHVTIAPNLTRKTGRTIFSDVVILNGPGTCFTLCMAVMVNKILGLPSPRLIFIESFARVQRLSLSGKLLKPFVDRFIVQWPNLLQGGKEECHGWLV